MATDFNNICMHLNRHAKQGKNHHHYCGWTSKLLIVRIAQVHVLTFLVYITNYVWKLKTKYSNREHCLKVQFIIT